MYGSIGRSRYSSGARFYQEGVRYLCRKLGFIDGLTLEEWAALNPHFWGNHRGEHLFGDSSAFCKGDYNMLIDKPLLLSDIAQWYEDVAERLLK